MALDAIVTIPQAVPGQTSGILPHLHGLAVGLFALSLIVADNRPFIYLLYAAFGLVAVMFALDVIVAGGRFSLPWLLRAYAAFAVYALVSIIWSRDPQIAMLRGTTIATEAIALPMVAHLLRRTVVLRYVLVYLALAMGLVVAILAGVLPFPGEIWSESGRFQGPFALATVMAKALLLVALTAYLAFFSDPAKPVRVLAAATLVVAFILMVPTMSRAGLAAAGVLVAAFAFSSPAAALGMLGLSALSGASIPLWLDGGPLATVAEGALDRALPLITLDIEAGSSADLRRQIVQSALETFAQDPVMGAGLASLESAEGLYAHNAWADIAANFGLIGLTLWAVMYWLLAGAVRRTPERRLRRAGYIALLSVFLFELSDAFYLSRTGMLAIVLLYVVMTNGRAGSGAAIARN